MNTHRFLSRPGRAVRPALLGFLILLAWLHGTTARAATDYAPPFTFTTIVGGSGIGISDGTGSAAQFNSAANTVIDGQGNLYVADSGNNTIRKMTAIGTNWVVTTLAGSPGVIGTNDGFGTNALFYSPVSLALLTNGNLYVADANNSTIRIVTPEGMVSTLAGIPGVATNSDTAPGVVGGFANPYGVAADSADNAYVADTSNGRIREVTPDGTITTLAGLFNTNLVVDGTNTDARFDAPIGIALDAAGNIYVADEDSDTIRRVSPVSGNWVVTTLAGKTNTTGTVDGTNSAARFSGPVSVAVDAATNLYVADFGDDTIRRVHPVGTNWVVSTLAGKTNTVGTANGTNTTARFNTPVGVQVDSATNLYIGDYGNSLIRKIMPVGTNWVVSTLAGKLSGGGTNSGPASVAQLNFPFGVAFDSGGNLYVSDEDNDAIRKMIPVPGGWYVTNFAGLPGTNGSVNGTGTGARFYFPTALAVDRAGNVYVADQENALIRKITPAGVVSVLAGSAGLTGTNNGTGANARFNHPFGLALDGATNVYVADTANEIIRKITPAGVVSTICGQPQVGGFKDGANTNALFQSPTSITIDSATNLYIVDYGNDCIRKVSPVGTNWVATTIAGQSGFAVASDGSNTNALFDDPAAITMDASGNLYVVEIGDDLLRKMTLDGPNWDVTTLAGYPLYAGDADGTGPNVRFNQPYGVAVDTQGNIFVADSGNNAIREGSPPGTITQPVIRSPKFGSAQVDFGITGGTNQAVDVEASSDMVNWLPVGFNYILSGGTNHFYDFTPPPEKQFYRVHAR